MSVYYLLEEMRKKLNALLPCHQEMSMTANIHSLSLCLKQYPRATFLPCLLPYCSRGAAPSSRDEYQLLFFSSYFSLPNSAFPVAALRVPHWTIYQSNVSWRAALLGMQFRPWCLCVLPELSWLQCFLEREGVHRRLVWNFSCFHGMQRCNTLET